MWLLLTSSQPAPPPPAPPHHPLSQWRRQRVNFSDVFPLSRTEGLAEALKVSQVLVTNSRHLRELKRQSGASSSYVNRAFLHRAHFRKNMRMCAYAGERQRERQRTRTTSWNDLAKISPTRRLNNQTFSHFEKSQSHCFPSFKANLCG